MTNKKQIKLGRIYTRDIKHYNIRYDIKQTKLRENLYSTDIKHYNIRYDKKTNKTWENLYCTDIKRYNIRYDIQQAKLGRICTVQT